MLDVCCLAPAGAGGATTTPDGRFVGARVASAGRDAQVRVWALVDPLSLIHISEPTRPY